MSDCDCGRTEPDSGSVLVWDAEGVPEPGFAITALWQGFEETPRDGERVVSVPRLVEEKADELRGRYLAWVYALGEAQVHGSTIAELMLIRPGLSYWWLASPAQKFSISATSLVPDAVKMLALEKYLEQNNNRAIVLQSDNARLAECLGAYCRQRGHCFDWRRHGRRASVLSRRAAYNWLPPRMRALISFGRYCLSRLPALFGKRDGGAAIGNVSFFDILVHLDKRSFESGRFQSNYWGPLVDRLSDGGVRTNWFHLFHPHPAVPGFAAAQRLVQRFQRSASGLQRHGLIDVFPSIATAVRAWRDYFRIQRSALVIDGLFAQVKPESSILNLWPLHEDEWIESVSGSNALMECLRLGLFEATLARLPKQQVGVYLCENQPWEMSLIHAWRGRGHGALIAAPHSTVRYWDLRYFYDRRSYSSGEPSGLPMPDYYAVNGPIAKAEAIAGGYPMEKIIEVEALRFMHLGRTPPSREPCVDAKNILICGDFLSTTNDRIFDWLLQIEANLPAGVQLVFKPHPAFPYCPDGGFSAHTGLRVDERPLGALLPECDIVVTSAITSAAVDAYCAGRQVIQIASGQGLNANALRGVFGARVVATSGDLAEALREALDGPPVAKAVRYFWLDPSLPAWMKALGRGMPPAAMSSSSGSGDR